MGITLRWYDEQKRVLVYCFEGDWLLEEYREKMRDANLMIATAGHMVHILLDLTRSNRQPFGMLSSRLYESEPMPANQGAIILCNAQYHMASILEIADRDGGYKPLSSLHFISSLEALPQLMAELEAAQR